MVTSRELGVLESARNSGPVARFSLLVAGAGGKRTYARVSRQEVSEPRHVHEEVMREVLRVFRILCM